MPRTNTDEYPFYLIISFHFSSGRNTQKLMEVSKLNKNFLKMGTRVKAGKMTSEVNGAERPFFKDTKIISWL